MFHNATQEPVPGWYAFGQSDVQPATHTHAASNGETCRKCGGTGQFRGYSGRVVGDCFTCHGTGRVAARVAPQGAMCDASKIQAALDRAGATLRAPKLRTAGLTFTLAAPDSANPGAIYAKAGARYLGKIKGGQFFQSRECGPDDLSRVLTVALDPMTAAINYGRETGSCSCCGRELTDPVSVARGIGPICAARYFNA